MKSFLLLNKHINKCYKVKSINLVTIHSFQYGEKVILIVKSASFLT